VAAATRTPRRNSAEPPSRSSRSRLSSWRLAAPELSHSRAGGPRVSHARTNAAAIGVTSGQLAEFISSIVLSRHSMGPCANRVILRSRRWLRAGVVGWNCRRREPIAFPEVRVGATETLGGTYNLSRRQQFRALRAWQTSSPARPAPSEESSGLETI